MKIPPRLLTLTLCVLIAACGTDGMPQPTTDSDARGDATVAFVSGAELRFADGAGHVWGGIPIASPYSPATWSADGKQFAWLDKTNLHIVTAATGVEKSQPCPCAGLGWFGEGFATVSADGSALLVFDRDGNPSRVPLRRPMPYAWVGAGGRDQVAVVEPIPEERASYRGQGALTAVDAKGQERLMIEGDSAVSFWGGSTSPDGTRVATIEAPSSGACRTSSSVLMLNSTGTNPKSEALIPKDSTFAEAVLIEARRVTGQTWAGSSLVVTFGPGVECHRLFPERFLSYQVDDGRMRLLRTGALQLGFGAAGRSYAIEIGDDIDATKDPEVRGRLTLNWKDKAPVTLADTVATMWLTPAEQAAGRPEAQTQPSEERIRTDDHGKPLSQEIQDLMGKLITALDGEDQSTLTALCARCDTDTLALIRTRSGREKLRRTLRTHPVLESGALTFPGLTESRCVDGRGPDGTCTREQLHDIGLLGLTTDFDSTDFKERYSAPVQGSIVFTVDKDGSVHWVGQSTTAKYRQQLSGSGDEPYYFFTSADRSYVCGIDKKQALCQGATKPVPPRPESCEKVGPSWGAGMSVDTDGKVDFLCAGGVMFYPVGREPNDGDVLPPGKTITALGFTCAAEPDGFRCTRDSHGFRIAPTSNETF
ncbi:hypothetical protein [Alloactinosynnema sp. L-07]|uniref:hypothetical protein n=1 Tax=Alloactinosynnema sp. L-07 TaxID=1653480 RepID=UPI00065F0838|nr:hypothetical protein [Alloactinosynnema sp. L-07]CRK59324.1 hypothetical protein [Alloactinosynnema sp. L-07]